MESKKDMCFSMLFSFEVILPMPAYERALRNLKVSQKLKNAYNSLVGNPKKAFVFDCRVIDHEKSVCSFFPETRAALYAASA